MTELIPNMNLSLLIYMSKFLLLALTASGVLLWICRQLRLFKRKKLVPNILTTVYYLYIPLVALGFTLLFFFAEYTKPLLAKAVSESAPRLAEYGEKRLEKLKGAAEASRAAAVVKEDWPALSESLKKDAAFSKFPAPVINAASRALAERLSEFAEEETGAVEKKAKAQAFAAKLESVVKTELGGFQRKVLIAAVLLLILPFAETAAAKIRGW